MKKLLLSAIVLACLPVMAAPVGIASGNPSGTNFTMVENIREVCSTPDSPINNVVTNGNLDNLFKVFSDPTAQYAITQTDVAFYQQQQDPTMMKKIQMVFPFFSSEIHIVVKQGSPIRSINDLAGKRVIEGPTGSGTWVSTQVIKSLTGLQWQPMNASIGDGFKMVMSNQADAEIIVAGAPVDVLSKSGGYQLVTLQHPALDKFAFYTRTIITSGVYGAVSQSVSTYKVDNMLVTFAFKNQYQKEIGDLVRCVNSNISKFQMPVNGQVKYHPKWRDVDPTDINRIKWQAHPSAVKVINGK